MRKNKETFSTWGAILACLVILCIAPCLAILAVICIDSASEITITINMPDFWEDIAGLVTSLLSVGVAAFSVYITLKNNRQMLVLERRKEQPCFDVQQGAEIIVTPFPSLESAPDRDELSLWTYRCLKGRSIRIPANLEALTRSLSVTHIMFQLPICNSGHGTIHRISIDKLRVYCNTYSYDNEQLGEMPPQIQGTYRINSGDNSKKLNIYCKYHIFSDEIDHYMQEAQSEIHPIMLLPHIEMKLRIQTLNGFEYEEQLTIEAECMEIDGIFKYYVRSDVQLIKPIID